MSPISTRPLRTLIALPVVLAALAFAPGARADALPPNECAASSSAGQACTTAGNGTQDGLCTEETCSHLVYLPDGGKSSAQSPCLLCEIPDSGPSPVDAGPTRPDGGPVPPDDAGPPPHQDAGPAPADNDAGASPSHLAGSSSCAVALVGAGPGGGLAVFGLGAVGLALSVLSRGRRRPKG